MAADVNRVTLTARLTRDVELRRTQSGMAIMNLGIAFNDRRKNAQTGEWEDQGNFADCVLFGARAESLASFLHKGSRVAIDGKLRYSSWQAQDGSKRSKLEITVDDLVMLDPRQNGSGGGYAPQGQQAGGYAYGNGNAPQTAPQQPQGGYQQAPQYQQQAQAAPQQAPVSSVYDEDIPF